MKFPHYTLVELEIQRDEHGETKTQLKGPLAPVLKNEIESSRLLSSALGGIARIKSGELLGINGGFDENDHFSAEVTGMLSPILGKKVLDGIESVFNQKVKTNHPIARRDSQRMFTLYQPAVPSNGAFKLLATRLLHKMTGRPRPSTATLQVTTRCQANCYHCSAARFHNRTREELTTDELKSVIRQTESLGVANVVFTGGEPMLRPDIIELVEFVDKNEANCMMFSNGLLLTEDNVKKLKEAGLYSINVSIDSPDPKEHNELRRVPNGFEKAVEGMKRIVDAGILCGVSTYASPERLRDGKVMQLIEMAHQIGCHEITIFDTVPTGKLLREEENILLTADDQTELCRIEEDLNARENYIHIITQAHVNGPTGAGCFASWFQFYMTAYGDVTPCDFTPLTFGNIREHALEECWDNMIAHPAYQGHCNHCRMQDSQFRAKWIDVLPESGPFPYPAYQIQAGVKIQEDPKSALDSIEKSSSIGIPG